MIIYSSYRSTLIQEEIDRLLKERSDLETLHKELNGMTTQEIWFDELKLFEKVYGKLMASQNAKK